MACTGKQLQEYLKKYGCEITDDHDHKYWEINWATLNKVTRSGTVNVIYCGNVMTDAADVYITFSVHPSGETFNPYSVAIPRNS